MTIRFLHIRECDEEGELLQTGGLTIVYTVSYEMKEIFLNIAKCSVNDQFSRKIGREVAEERLKKDGPLEMLELFHPISETLRWWFVRSWKCSLFRNSNGTWMSTFMEEAVEDLVMARADPLPDAEFFLAELETTTTPEPV